jgi:hypothetical protein
VLPAIVGSVGWEGVLMGLGIKGSWVIQEKIWDATAPQGNYMIDHINDVENSFDEGKIE